MRRLSLPSRALSALFALWFVLVFGDQGTMRECPMQGGHASHGAMDHMSHDMGAAQHGHHAPASPNEPAPPCSCVGSCSTAATFAQLTVPPTFVVPVEVAAVPAPHATYDIEVLAAPDLRLPFANGPPLV